ncbi:MAG: caspase family protein [Proteobacteria bacterium]|nr:hypothetical protein [Desulfobacteraceae bacterium]MBU4012757.1 caspase family protein [Pseudomonadota bacterium]MBU4127845.1 caspase family protein [Pseudomonadota bacterium]
MNEYNQPKFIQAGLLLIFFFGLRCLCGCGLVFDAVDYSVYKSELPDVDKSERIPIYAYIDQNSDISFTKEFDFKYKTFDSRTYTGYAKIEVGKWVEKSLKIGLKRMFVVPKGFRTDQDNYFKILFRISEVKYDYKWDHKISKDFYRNWYDVTTTLSVQYECIHPDGEVIDLGTVVGSGKGHDNSREAFMLAVRLASARISSAIIDKLKRSSSLNQYVQAVKQQREEPCSLMATINYTDATSIIPNNTIDSGEESTIMLTVKNEGKGTAFDVKVNLESDYENIRFPNMIPIGDIRPGESKKARVNIIAHKDLNGGTISFWIVCTEKRGYDSKKYTLKVSTSKLDRPEIVISSYKINDGNTGLASGNGNGIPENGETIEIIPFIKNNGVGKAVRVNLSIQSINSGIDIKQNNIEIPQIMPNQTIAEKLSFHIPRSYSGGDIEISITASDIRGVSEARKLFAINTKTNQPILAYSYKILDRNNNGFIENGEEAEIEIIPSNKGDMDAKNVKIDVQSEDLIFSSSNMNIDRIAANSKYVPSRFSFKVPRTLQKDSVDIKVQFNQKDFSGLTDYINLPVKLVLPDFNIIHQILDSNSNGIIEQGESVDLIVKVRNIGNLDAEDVFLNMDINKEGIALTGSKTVNIGRISSGKESEPKRFSFILQRRTSIGELPIKFKIDQKEFSSKDIYLSLNVAEEQAEVITVAGEKPPTTITPTYNSSYNAPPVIAIASPKNNWKVASESEMLVGTIVDDRGIANIEIAVNGQRLNVNPMRAVKIIGKTNNDSKKIPLEIEIPLQTGSNHIVIKAYDIENVSSTESITIFRESERGEIWGVVIGIDRYQNVPSLNYAQKDAKEYANYLRHYMGLDDNHLMELYDEQATATEIRTILGDELYKKAYKPEDTVFIFYAGHGAPDKDPRSKDGDGITKYILPHNADPKRLFGTAIRMDEIADIFNRIGAERVVFFADSCFSGASGGRTVLAKGSRAILSDAFLNRLTAGKGRIILTSSNANEVSQESEKFKHGIFTYYLLKGLKGDADYNNDNEINIDELSLYLKSQVRKETNGAQNPVKRGDAEGQVVVGHIK